MYEPYCIGHRGWFIHGLRDKFGHLVVRHSDRGVRAYGVGSKADYSLVSQVSSLLRGTELNDLSLSLRHISLSLFARGNLPSLQKCQKILWCLIVNDDL